MVLEEVLEVVLEMLLDILAIYPLMLINFVRAGTNSGAITSISIKKDEMVYCQVNGHLITLLFKTPGGQRYSRTDIITSELKGP